MKTRIQTIVLAASVVLRLVPLDASTSFPGQNQLQSTPSAFGAGFIVHESRIESQSGFELSSVGEVPAQAPITSAQVPVPTRSSFMASWDGVTGATGYRLDVSTSSLFTSYADGYHELDVGNSTGRVVTGLDPGATYFYRARAYDATGPGRYSDVMTVTTVATTGLNIHAIFDSSITGNPNAAAIEAMINQAISIYESLFSDPITIEILFRYSTTAPDGTPLPPDVAGLSLILVYDTEISWSAFINALRADAKTSNDNLANASLPGDGLSPNIGPSSANGRSIGLNTPPQPYPPGTHGAPYDGIITLNPARPLQFTRPVSANYIDAQTATEHEIDEVLGLGSHINSPTTDFRPQDLFSWSSAGIRNLTSSGTRYFSINGGVTNIVNFNQDPSGDFGDWLSEDCPQAHPYVQNATGCAGQSSDVTATSPEGVNLDVIGYDLVNAPVANADIFWQNTVTGECLIWIMNGTTFAYGVWLPTEPTSWSIAGTGDFNRDGNADILWQNTVTGECLIWIMNGTTFAYGVWLPTEPTSWSIAGTGDFNRDGTADILWQNTITGERLIWIMNGTTLAYGVWLPTEPTSWSIAGTGDFNRDGNADIIWQNTVTGECLIWIMNGATLAYGVWLPTEPTSWSIAGTGDFNRDGTADILWQNTITGERLIWIMNGTTLAYGVWLPTEPTSWSIVN